MLVPHDQSQKQCPFHSARFPHEEFERKRPTYDGIQKMDIIPLDPKDWLRFDEDYLFLMEEKRHFLKENLDKVLKTNTGALTASKELLSAIIIWLKEHQNEFFEFSDDSIFCKRRDIAIQINWSDPLQTITSLIPEDVVILTRDEQKQYRLTAGSLCFPSAWSLEEKSGLTVQEIHAPVPNLNKNIGGKIDQLLDVMTPERPVWRINFLINFNPKLSQIPGLPDEADFERPIISTENIGELLWLRQERETISKLPLSDAIVFTLKTYQTQLKNVPNSSLKVLSDLHQDLDSDYRDNYRKLQPEEQLIFMDYIKNRLSR